MEMLWGGWHVYRRSAHIFAHTIARLIETVETVDTIPALSNLSSLSTIS